MNHSNSVFLLNDINVNNMGQKVLVNAEKESGTPPAENMLVGFADNSFEYELLPTSGSITANRLPLYDGNDFEPTGYGVTELLADSPVSRGQFFKAWYEICGCEVEGSAVILAQDFVTEALSVLIPLIISIDGKVSSSERDLDISQLSDLMAEQNNLYTSSVCRTIIHKFGDVDVASGKFKLRNVVVSRWFGIQALAREALSLDCNQFLLRWKGSLPNFYNVPLDLQQLKGYYFKPTSTLIQYLDPQKFTGGNAATRIKELFQVSKEWELDDFTPFIDEFVPAGKTADSVILKHARKKRVGKNKYIVCSR